jgi:hypothetical protein
VTSRIESYRREQLGPARALGAQEMIETWRANHVNAIRRFTHANQALPVWLGADEMHRRHLAHRVAN